MSAPPRAAPSPAPSADKRRGVPAWLWAVGAVVAVVVGLGVYGASLPDTKPTPPMPAPQQNPPAVQPQTTDGSPQAIILAQLQQAQTALAQQGFQQVGQPATGGLQQGQTWNVPAQLAMGYDYRILGVCDRDCSDLDLVLFDAAGAPILQDTAVSSQPMLAILPGYSGNYTVQVQMYQCTVAPCYWALALYGRVAQ